MTSLENQNKICCIIPFFNEEKNLPEVISKTIDLVDKLILVNDGSTDSSTYLIPKSKKIILIEHKTNLGKGSALKTGFCKSIELGFDITITLDGDGQHDPSYIPKIVKELEKFDCIIGARQRSSSSMPYHRRLSNYLTSAILSVKTGCKILDSQSGYRGFMTNIIGHILPTYTGFEAESEIIVKLCRNNYTIGFIEVPTIYGTGESKMRAFDTIKGFIKVILSS